MLSRHVVLVTFIIMGSFSVLSAQKPTDSLTHHKNTIGFMWSYQRYIGLYYNRDFKRSFAECSYVNIPSSWNGSSIWGEYGYFLKNQTKGSFVTLGLEMDNYTFIGPDKSKARESILYLYSKYGYRIMLTNRVIVQPTIGLGYETSRWYSYSGGYDKPISSDPNRIKFDIDISIKVGFAF